MKKPLTVKVVEALGWVYVALAVMLWAMVMMSVFKNRIEWPEPLVIIFVCLCWMMLPVGMVLSLRKGKRDWFLWPNAFFFGLFLLGAVNASSRALALIVGLPALILLIAPVFLLHTTSADRWFNEMSGDEYPGRLGCAVILCVIVFILFIVPVVSDICISSLMAESSAMAMRCRNLFVRMASNKTCREEGEDWIDPSRCTNSTQFVQALLEKYDGEEWDGRYTDIWCIAVNPPDDGSFPLLITSNVNPRELLFPENAESPIALTCPRKWGGTCFKFCEKSAVIVRSGGSAQVLKGKYLRANVIFRDGIPKLGPHTYFLTPTGRIDFVEHQRSNTDLGPSERKDLQGRGLGPQ